MAAILGPWQARRPVGDDGIRVAPTSDGGATLRILDTLGREIGGARMDADARDRLIDALVGTRRSYIPINERGA